MTSPEANIRKLGFGLMRLPMKGSEVDIEQTKQMVDLFMENGFSYFDTAYRYIDGKSEEAVKTVLTDRYPRNSFLLASKLPAWSGAKTAAEARQMFWTSLKRTGAGYFDFYLLHNVGNERTKIFDDFRIWEFLQEQKDEGLIKHIGFSFHDKADALDEVLTLHPEMEFVQLQINYADWESFSVESRRCHEVAGKHNKPVIIMEPLKGGSLSVLPDKLAGIFKSYNAEASLSSWALRYAASLDGILTVLSGMSTLEQMKDNISFMKNFIPLSSDEMSVIRHVQEELKLIPNIPCTDCQYCIKGCPRNILIPKIFSTINLYLSYSNLSEARRRYKWDTRNGGAASGCIECGQCESSCPQHINIVEELKNAADLLEG